MANEFEEIVVAPDERLSTECAPIEVITPEIRALSERMLADMYATEGCGLAAPQIGVAKRLICILTDKPYVIINPTLTFIGDEMMEVMDDCMSFPKLLVRVRRFRHCILRYLDEHWEPQEKQMDDDMAELIQHEYDHLDGILATMRAIDEKSFVMKR